MKIKILVSAASMVVMSSFAQQQNQYSMYMMNNFLLNPAVGGTEDYIDFKAGLRTQWVGLEGQPKSVFFSAHSPIGKQKTGFEEVKPLPYHSAGGLLSSDITGVLNKTAFYGSYAFHLPITSKLNFSVGAFLGLQQYRLNQSELKAHDQTADPSLTNTSQMSPDGSIGVWLYSKRFYVGGSSLQILNMKMKLSEAGNSAGKLNRHFFATTGVRVKLNNDWTLVPSILVKAINPAPLQVDLNAKVRYKNMIWGGVSYRNMDAIVGLIGVVLDNKYEICYSYDYNTSNLGNYNSGSHEIVLGYRLHHLKAKPVPAQFW